MARARGPLFSQTAQKQLGKTIIFKTKAGKTFVTKYNKPGDQNPFTPSASQNEKRALYGEAVEQWQSLEAELKEYWNNLANEETPAISGWNLFYKMVFTDSEGYFRYSIYGTRFYGYLEYGKEDE